jgi:hypothetical protein
MRELGVKLDWKQNDADRASFEEPAENLQS